MDEKPMCYCQKPSPDQNPNTFRTFHSPEDEVKFITAEAHRIEDLIAYLQQERGSLLRRMNSIQSSTRSLPSELLSQIFRHAYPLRDYFEDPPDVLDRFREDLNFHLTLASVSSQWRQVVLSTPQLWSFVGAYNARKKLEEFLQASLDRSHGAQFDIARSGSIFPTNCVFITP